jgi:Undecaprenyl-phosphate galactose phosphotransferase WbaP
MENAEINLQSLSIAMKRVAPRGLERHMIVMMTASMVISDLLGLAIAGGIAVGLRWVLLGPFRPDLVTWFVPLGVLMVLLFSLRHLYPGIGLGAVEEFKGLTISISLMFIIASAILLALHEGWTVSRFAFGTFWLASMVIIPALRRLVLHGMTRIGLWGAPMAIIGPADAAVKLYEQLSIDPKVGLRPVVVFTPRGEGRDKQNKALVYPIEQMEELVKQNKLRMAAVLYEELDQVEEVITRYRETFERLVLFNTNGNHHFLNKVSIQHYGGLISLDVHHRLLDPWAQTIKRAMDIILSGVALLILYPFYLVVAGLIYIDSPGRILYRQLRLGKRGKPFTMYKLRTMYLNADDILSSTLTKDPTLREEWDRYQKLKEDPRITRVGRILRRFSIDELAQLWNVLRGEMSLVGPRPIMLNQQEMYGENYQHYVRVAPGISGLWQINGRNQTSFSKRAEVDMEYVISWSVWLDIYIIVRTIWVVLRRDGAF